MATTLPLKSLASLSSRCAIHRATASSSRLSPSRAGRTALRPACASSSYRRFGTCSICMEKKYTEDHEWVELSDDGKTGTIGITTFAANQLGDVVFVELPTVSTDAIRQGDAIGAVESVKSAADINTPISGSITAVNEVLAEKPSTINKAPETGGWIAKLAVDEGVKAEVGGLMSKEVYDKFTSEE